MTITVTVSFPYQQKKKTILDKNTFDTDSNNFPDFIFPLSSIFFSFSTTYMYLKTLHREIDLSFIRNEAT